MADYKELLRRAIEALPENNGAARRAVYEKARSALVGQLRAIDPPLPAREITQHRLQLEDCIRQVEQDASEAVIAGLRQQAEASAPKSEPAVEPEPAEIEAEAESETVKEPETAPEPVVKEAAAETVEVEPEAETAPEESETVEPEAVSEVEPVVAEADEPQPQSIEDIIAAEAEAEAESGTGEDPAPEGADEPEVIEATAEAEESGDAEDAPEPESAGEPREPEEPEAEAAANDGAPPIGGVTSIVARAEANKSAPSSPLPFRNPLKRPSFEPRRDAAVNVVAAQRIEPAMSGQAVARQRVAEPLAVVEQQPSVALSSVREVELEPAADPQQAIDRAIETLDREARGESTGDSAGETTIVETDSPEPDPVKAADTVAKAHEEFEETEVRDRSGGALTIFLLVFVLLLAGVGGAGYWAWHEGYVDPAAMFGQNQAKLADTPVVTPTPATPMASMGGDTAAPANNTAPSVATETAQPDAPTGPGNTTTSSTAVEPTQELKNDDRLLPENDVIAAETEPAPPTSESKDDARLPTGDAANPATPGDDAALDAATLAGSQSLLLEASDDGTTGAVPFTGTVEWSEGKDETGLPTLIGKANIPARNLGVDVLIRKNSDPSLPASHLMEINFNVSETFMGGSIAGLPGVLLKNEELVQGTPLIGASARVVGNSFLFALSASPDDATTNNNLLTTRKWMDLALIYATGKRAIITLEKDDKATALFTKVFGEWAKAGPATAAAKPQSDSDQG